MPTNKLRISINLPGNEYGELAALAEKHNISMAWIGRKAIVDLLEPVINFVPLFAKGYVLRRV